ncbi:MAG: serine/threonine-protein kinase, partial [Verrucomicrobiota bacterium]
LEQACGKDVALRKRVDQLLEAYFETGFLEKEPDQPAVPVSAAPDFKAPLSDPEQVGPYKILRRIGEGGFGAVYEAQQMAPIRRKVALKMIKLGMDTEQMIRRFESERQTLALMDHPGIASVYDAGATETGRPYFVMQLVEGQRITTYSDENQLSVSDRLQLFGSVCQAVQHAHQKGIIHRDLKPSNILVAEENGEPTPKVIDFGIARAMEPGDDGATLFTREGEFVGTPAYVSPEHANGLSSGQDIRSDVYSLGILLYELLVGETPFQKTTGIPRNLDEWRKRLRSQEPVRPSVRFGELSLDDQRQIASRRRLGPDRLKKHLTGELGWIVLKAISEDPDDRYQAARGLHDDLDRYLRKEPILAGPPSVAYRTRKFVQRNVRAVLASLVFGLLLAAGWFWTQAEKRNQEGQFALQTLLTSEPSALSQSLDLIHDHAGKLKSNLTEIQKGGTLAQQRRARLALLAEEPSLLDRVLNDCLIADVAEFPAYLKAIESYRKEAIPLVADVAIGFSHRASERLRAGGVLAHLEGAFDWEAVAPSLVDALVAEPGFGPNFESVADFFIPETRKRYEAGTMEAGRVLLPFFREAPEGLVSLIPKADPVIFSSTLPMVRNRRSDCLPMLKRSYLDYSNDLDQWAASLANEGKLVVEEQHWETTAEESVRLVLAMAAIGDWERAIDLMADYHPVDPTRRYLLIHAFAKYGFPRNDLVQQLRASTKTGVRQGLLLALADYTPTELPLDFRQSLESFLMEQYVDADPGLHAATDWLLRKWNMPILSDEESLAARRWRKSSLGHTMIRFEPVEGRFGSPFEELGRGKKEVLNKRKRKIPYPFEIQDRVVSFGDFERFVPGFLVAQKEPPRVDSLVSRNTQLQALHRKKNEP